MIRNQNNKDLLDKFERDNKLHPFDPLPKQSHKVGTVYGSWFAIFASNFFLHYSLTIEQFLMQPLALVSKIALYLSNKIKY